MYLCWSGADEREEITRMKRYQESEANERCTGRESGLDHVDLTDPGWEGFALATTEQLEGISIEQGKKQMSEQLESNQDS